MYNRSADGALGEDLVAIVVVFDDHSRNSLVELRLAQLVKEPKRPPLALVQLDCRCVVAAVRAGAVTAGAPYSRPLARPILLKRTRPFCVAIRRRLVAATRLHARTHCEADQEWGQLHRARQRRGRLVNGVVIVGLALSGLRLRSLQGARVGLHRESTVVLHVLHVAAPAPQAHGHSHCHFAVASVKPVVPRIHETPNLDSNFDSVNLCSTRVNYIS